MCTAGPVIDDTALIMGIPAQLAVFVQHACVHATGNNRAVYLCSCQCVWLCRLFCQVHRFGQLLLHVVLRRLPRGLLLLLLLLSIVLSVRRTTVAGMMVAVGS
jgi:hypothetical protein